MGSKIMIAAAGEHNELGKDNQLLWHLPDDFRRFKRLTTGHPMIMGRKTFESFDKPLPNRQHIVISRDRNYQLDHPACVLVHDLESAFDQVANEDTVFIIGGGEIYRQALPYTDIIELTRVHGIFEADTFFPEIDSEIWQLSKQEYHERDARHDYAFSYRTYARRDRNDQALETRP